MATYELQPDGTVKKTWTEPAKEQSENISVESLLGEIARCEALKADCEGQKDALDRRIAEVNAEQAVIQAKLDAVYAALPALVPVAEPIEEPIP